MLYGTKKDVIVTLVHGSFGVLTHDPWLCVCVCVFVCVAPDPRPVKALRASPEWDPERRCPSPSPSSAERGGQVSMQGDWLQGKWPEGWLAASQVSRGVDWPQLRWTARMWLVDGLRIRWPGWLLVAVLAHQNSFSILTDSCHLDDTLPHIIPRSLFGVNSTSTPNTVCLEMIEMVSEPGNWHSDKLSDKPSHLQPV